MDVDVPSNPNFVYLIEQIRSNLLTLDSDKVIKETPRAHAWLLTTLSIYGEDLSVLIALYRLFREQHSYTLLSFITEHILQRHLNELDKNHYLQHEFQSIFGNSSEQAFSYSRLNSLLSSSARELISSLLTRQWYDELKQALLLSSTSTASLNQCREKALACLSLSPSSVPSTLELVLSSEAKIGFNTKLTSLNILRCLFVQDLLPVVLESRQRYGIQAHACHRWLIGATEFYMEYAVKSWKNNQMRNGPVTLEGSGEKTFQCENPIEQMEKLMNLAMTDQENFQWQQFLIHQGNQVGSFNRRQKLLELRVLVERAQHSAIRCPLECFIFCTSFPIYVQSVFNLSALVNNVLYQDYLFISSTPSIQTLLKKSNEVNHVELNENFFLFVECLSLLQPSQSSSCVQLYQETIEKIHLHANVQSYQRLLRIFYFYYVIQKSKGSMDNKSVGDTNQNKSVVIDDTPQSPTMQDDVNGEASTLPTNSPLTSPDIEALIAQLNDHSLESRLQLCSLYSITQHRSTVSFCIDTLIYLQENSPSYNHQPTVLPLSSDYCFISRSYPIFFDYILDILLQHLSPTLILLQRSSSSSGSVVYPKALLSTLSPLSLRYIYDQKLLGQLIKYIQTTTTAERRWTANSHKRKHDDDEANKLTDEQFIEKIIQHVSNIAQWTDEQRRSAIYAYLLDERQTLLNSFSA